MYANMSFLFTPLFPKCILNGISTSGETKLSLKKIFIFQIFY